MGNAKSTLIDETGDFYDIEDIMSNTWQITILEGTQTDSGKLSIHNRYNDVSFGQGSIAEMIVYDTDLNEANKQTIRKYLTQKWGLSDSVDNDGDGILIEFMEDHKMFPPELIFGSLLTSTNYDDNEKRVPLLTIIFFS